MKALEMALVVTAALMCGMGRANADQPKAITPPSSAAAPANLSTQEIVAARRASFYLSAMTMARMKDALANPNSNIKEMKWPAQFLATWAAVLPSMFPASSYTDSSQAKPSVWSDRAGFLAAAQQYQAAAAELSRIAETGDRADFAAGRQRLADACNSCHTRYRND